MSINYKRAFKILNEAIESEGSEETIEILELMQNNKFDPYVEDINFGSLKLTILPGNMGDLFPNVRVLDLSNNKYLKFN